jgi:flagellar basal-body rod protein FlgB
MSNLIGGMFNFSDRLNMEAMTLRNTQNEVITANVANAETPGYRAIGYSFEDQLQAIAGTNEPLPMKVSNLKHLRNPLAQADGTVRPEVFVRPTESIPEDGNTVDMDREMADLAQNQIMFRAAVEILNRKIGTLRYAINGGGR